MKSNNATYMYAVNWSSKFKKEYKLAIRRNYKIEELDEVIITLAKGETLPEKYEDHALEGNWKGHRECHIRPDWVASLWLAYRVLRAKLARNQIMCTGTHADLFKA